MSDGLQRLGRRLTEWVHAGRWLFREKSACEYVRMMYPREKREDALRRLWGGRLVLFLFLTAVAAAVWLCCFLAEPEPGVLREGRYLSRQNGDIPVEIDVTGVGDSGEWKRKVRLNLKERDFTAEEKDELERQLRGYAEQNLPGGNGSLDRVTKPLRFFSGMPETGIETEWFWDEEFIRDDGTLAETKIPPEGVDTEIMLRASWRNWKETLYFKAHLMRPELDPETQQIRNVKEVLRQTLKDSASEEVVELPSSVGDIRLTYQMEAGKKNYMPVYLILVFLFLLPVFWRERQKKAAEGREEQMYLDYPGIVNKVMLLLGAGMTFRRSVERLAFEYERARQEGGEIHYAYEELCIMTQEMRDGVSEGQAVENFGRKCRMMPYLRFSSVITQNLKKGAEGILDLLEQEALEAMEQRRERVLQLGETAGTKLLFPMIIMLGLVMGIILVPAFMTM